MEFVTSAGIDVTNSTVESDTSCPTISVDGRYVRRRQIANALKSKERRKEFVRQQIEVGLPFQIKAMRKRRKWNQGDFGKQLGKPQSVVSRLESPGYGRFTIATLLEIAAAYDVALQVAFVPFSSLVNRAAGFSIDDVAPQRFDDDAGLQEQLVSGTSNVFRHPTAMKNTGSNYLKIQSSASSKEAAVRVGYG